MRSDFALLICALLVVIAVAIVTCNNNPNKQVITPNGEVVIVDKKYPTEVYIFTFDGHDYIQFGKGQYSWGTHHPECPNKKHQYEKTSLPMDSNLSNNYYYLRTWHQ